MARIPFILALILFTSAVQAQLFKPGNVAVKIRANSNVRVNDFPLDAPFVSSAQPVLKQGQNRQNAESTLDNVFILETSKEQQTLSWLRKHPSVIYAEPIPEERALQIPNDPLANPTTGGQGYLGVVKAYEAWDVTQGSEDIIIGIVDSGMALEHEDLTANYYVNPVETENGIDDDGNGYIDDIIGYDFADNDNDPQAETDITSGLNHGTHVGGVAGATANNGIGIAGIGYNTKIAPLKGFTTIGYVGVGLWEAVLYAANNGYDIANLSWGNTAGFKQFFQDLVNYCVLEKDMVLIAAAGNTNADIDFYPASYEHVISVGASTNSDVKWGSGTFSHNIDIMAPGSSILSTQKNNTYNVDSGSSHASPMVAGAAALVKSVFPQYNARQVMEQLRTTADDIYDLNPSYPYKLGKGRLNVHAAVTENNAKSVRMTNFHYDNGFGQYAFFGDTVSLDFDLINYLAPINNLLVSLETDSPYATLIDQNSNEGSLGSMDIKSGSTFKILLDDSTPPETEIDIRFLFSDGTYSDFQNLSFKTEPNQFLFGDGDFKLNLFGSGDLAFENVDLTDGSPGTFNGSQVLKHVGLMIGTGITDLNDNITNTFSLSPTKEQDFTNVENLRLERRDSVSLVGYSSFESTDQRFRLEQSIMHGESHVLLRYRIANTTGSFINELYGGFFADFFLDNQTNNRAYWSEDLNCLIMTDINNTTFAALGMIGAGYSRWALDMQFQNGNSQDIDGDFTDAEKFTMLSSPSIDQAGSEGIGNDVALMLGTNLGSLNDGESTELSVFMAMATTLEDLSEVIDEINDQHQRFKSSPKTKEVISVCAGSDFELNPTDGSFFEFYKDPLGSEIIANAETLLLPNLMNDTIIYVRNIDAPFNGDIEQIKISPKDQVAFFQTAQDTVYLQNSNVLVQFHDLSIEPINWQWDFGNGSQSSLQNPAISFDQLGTYQISLTVLSDLGCEETYSQELVVAARPETPSLSDYNLCQYESIELVHPSEEYALYDNQGIQIVRKEIINMGPFEQDSTLIITQWINGFESLPIEINVNIDPLMASFTVYPDTLSSETSALFLLDSENADSYEWKVNGTVESTSDSFTFHISGGIELTLSVNNANCSDQIIENLTFQPSSTPIISPATVCTGDNYVLTPSNGNYFGFYEDEQLNNLIKKGTRLLLSNLVMDQSVWVVGLDSILPSEPVEAFISLSEFDPEITANPSSLDITTGNTVQFSIDGDVTEAAWYVDGQLVETALNPLFFFTEIGEYEIRLVASNDSGCTNEATLNYQVFLPVLGNSSEIIFSIYPNPSSGIINIKSEEHIQSVSILNLTGKVLERHGQVREIKTDLSTGVYLIQVQTPAGTRTERISIK